jgi:hypothetical protein
MPRAAANIPQYLDRVITLCRQQHPNDRPAAWELIEMFPSDKDILKQIDDLNDSRKISNRNDDPATSRARMRRLEAVRALYDSSISCDVCSERCSEVHYHCETCESGNYDLCQACFFKGLHCRNRAHWLVKVELAAYANHNSSVQVIHLSSPNMMGQREQSIV